MVALRSRRLESMLGTSLDNLKAQNVLALANGQVEEAFDLDFKESNYGNTDSDKRALASDVAALANTAGGIIIIGVKEDDQARATATPGVKITDEAMNRMRQIIAAGVAPLPTFDIIPVYEACDTPHTDASCGCIVIAVPRSPSAPHAVLVNDALRFPRRNGATTRFLAESEVAAAYRDRFRSRQQQQERVQNIEQEAIFRLAPEHSPWIVVSLVPELPGDMPLNYQSFRVAVDEFQETILDVLGQTSPISRVRVGPQRLLLDSTANRASPHSEWTLLELHTDGAGVYACRAGDLNQQSNNFLGAEDEQVQLVQDELLAIAILSSLHQLARCARDRCASGGYAKVRAQLHPVSPERPTAIGHARRGVEIRSPHPLTIPPPPAEITVSLETIAAIDAEYIGTAATLLDTLGHAYGISEMGQLSAEGTIRRPYWNPVFYHQVSRFCEEHGIDFSSDQM